PDPALAAAPHHPPDRDCARGGDGYFLRGTRHRPTPAPQPGDPQFATLVRGLSAGAAYIGPPEDGRVREPHLAQAARLPGGCGDCRLQRLASGADLCGLDHLMYNRLLVRLHNRPADGPILKRVTVLVKL